MVCRTVAFVSKLLDSKKKKGGAEPKDMYFRLKTGIMAVSNLERSQRETAQKQKR